MSSWWKKIWEDEFTKTDFVKEYEDKFRSKTNPDTPLDQLTFCILDTETTGLNVNKDYILSFGALKVKKYHIHLSDLLEIYVKAPLVKSEALSVHEIVQKNDAEELSSFAQHSLQYIGNSIVVGHHVGFDIQMLQKTYRPFGLKKLLNKTIDTFELAVRLEKGYHFNPELIRNEEYSLDALCKRYKIPLHDRHTASGDAMLTAILFMKLLKSAENKSITKLSHL
ncbi:3'-5' exonuclease [Litoribacter ruber]|uniref:3'-5' exonuclease n=1 Tax=Litoribacter ruber TaxID=702568 RepID=A0AAP2G0P0_9BACT|nr:MULTISPECIES: 3'-5' exonuclease [Litoribacter]MBS9522667.1 3'-5' exonuclease [Litoribacter alkaliphilus]MBT0811196.1 3'-5' exonuclease [Litoribacter ruber]